jgi:TetR/AcrR family transcriptional regulator, regulator of cefoperazone and chloramphenicol sensitivity
VTRDHLLDHAAELFAERGFKKVTVREISERAGANVAAVNYHFGDKLGLYREIVERAIPVMEETTKLAVAAGKDAPPDEQLRLFVRVFVERLLAPRAGSHIQRIMMREMEDPTEMLDVIARRVMQPRMEYLCAIVGRLLGRRPGDRIVRNSAVSIHAQCLMCKTSPALSKLRTSYDYGPADAAALAGHIADFSLLAIAGIRRRHRPTAARRRPTARG